MVRMRLFGHKEVDAAIRFAGIGGQALHVWNGADKWARAVGAPSCFQRSKQAAHLFDQDAQRLTQTARRLGVRVIFIDKQGTDRQHIDLCGKPLQRAIAETKRTDTPSDHKEELLFQD